MTNQPTAHTPVRTAPGQWSTQCCWCGETMTSKRKPAPMMGCNRTACHEAHNAAALARTVAPARRRPAAKRVTTVPASDWNMLVAFSAGRKAGK